MKNIFYPIIIALITLVALSSCHKVNGTEPTAYLGLHLHTSIDSVQLDPIVYNAYYTDSLGRSEKLSVAQFYLTNIAIRNSTTQQWYSVPNSIILKRIQQEEYPIGSIPAGTYDDVRFTVGLSNALNAKTPSWYSTTDADSVLSTIEQAVMWGSGLAGTSSTTGYTFMNVQGYDSTDHTAFSYQLGGLGDTVQVTMPPSAAFTIGANEPQVVQYVHIICDYGTLLQNVNLTSPANANGSFYSTTPQNVTNATNLLNNIAKMFRYECSTPNGAC